jgi:hypothetical protein
MGRSSVPVKHHLGQVRRQVEWARREGVRRVLRETDVSPVRRSRRAIEKWRYRRTARTAPFAMPAYIIGLQRSGTTVLTRCLGDSPRVELHNEADSRAFDHFRLRGDDVIRGIVTSSDHAVVLFKPLCDSHMALHLLDGIGTPTPARAVWAFRSPAGRVRSSLGKFGAHNLTVLSEIARGTGLDRWQAGGLSAESLDLIRSFDYERLSPASAAALFWYVRNQLVFDLGLDRRDDVLMVHYDEMIARPEGVFSALCEFLGIPLPPMRTRIERHRHTLEMPGDVHPDIARRCAELDARLVDLSIDKLAAVGA